ncbi:MAG: hypothetical protein NXY57DRAFT_1117021 [Lentinula lateritia]|uniref:F-box domain-containing protein n=1 Tax=Lentinula lateritia TaxID=40482 RepID=A0ABQ8V368_9AGAR|nr:MAG: hypothetical protein NXY57DRAFT_1117021 [Lentinula lateritia]KAJ4466026.1 hypothetical protein C8R41DRAFT_926279 [Lentinula lateritia]
MDTLPIEILTDVLGIVLQDAAAKPTNILCTSSQFQYIAQRILHRDLCFYSSSQLSQFASLLSKGTLSLVCEPQTLMLDIAGGASSGIFEGLYAVLTEILSNARCKKDENGRANARNFMWTGPDPPHHFSTAIVSPAVFPLFTALSTYSRLTHLHLTNIAFPNPIISPDAHWTGIPCLPSLRSFHLGQATFLTTEHIADFVLRCTGQLQNSSCNLKSSKVVFEHIRLVDVYEESIWGPRLKLPRILSACTTMLEESQSSNEMLSSTISDLIDFISVDAKTERIVGGDRVIPEVLTILATTHAIV